MKNKYLLFLIIPSLLLPSCSSEKKAVDKQTPYRVSTQEGSKTTITGSNGAPLVLTSCEFRSDIFLLADQSKPEDLEDYFALAKETNFNSVDLPFMWSQLEKEKDQYSFDDLDVYLNLAKKYGLLINLLWYGSFVDGETHTINMPKYIYEDSVTYPVIQFCYPNSIFGDTVIMNYSNKNLLNRESLAVKALFNHVAEWNLQNEKYNPIVILQCGQGLDRLERYRIEQYDVQYNGERMTNDQAEIFVEDYATAISKAAKNSKYSPITRVEFCEQTAVTSYVRSVEQISTIDVLATTYLGTVPLTKTGIYNFSEEYGNSKPIMCSENWSNDLNYRSALVTYAMGGCGFNSYNLSSPIYYPLEAKTIEYQIGGALYRRKKSGVESLEGKFAQINTRAEDIASVNNMVNQAYVPIAKALKENFALMGFDSKYIKEHDGHQKVYLESGVMFDYQTNKENSFGYVINSDNFVYVISNGDGVLKLENCSIQNVSEGFFDEDGFWKSESIIYTFEDGVSFKEGKLYRIRVNDVLDLPTIEWLEEQSYKDTNNIVRG